MARSPEAQTINGHRWEVTPWPGMYGVKMQARLAPLVSGAVAPMLEAVGGAQGGSDPMEALMDMDVDKVVSTVLQHVDEQQTPKLIEMILHGAFVDGRDITQQVVFDEHFQANYGELYKGLMFVIKTNMGDLFSAAAPTGNPEAAAE